MTNSAGMLVGALVGAGLGNAFGRSLPASDERNVYEYHCYC
ncbi:glycine zipper domain-containing protein [Nocardia sp. BMG111209]